MALPKQNYTGVPNVFFDKIMKELSGNEVKVFLAICRKTLGWHKETDSIAASQIARATGVSEGGVKAAIKGLEVGGWIVVDRVTGGRGIGNSYTLNIEQVETPPKTIPLSGETPLKTIPLFELNPPENHTPQKKEEKKENKESLCSPPYQEIIDDLNAVTGSSFRHTSKATQESINGRWGEGYILDDFKAVHSIKAMQWKGDPAMSKYLCPDTLYRPSKFEKYLQEAKRHFPHIELDVEEKIFSEETEDAVERWKLLYPGLDVNGELLDVLEWTLECPKERPKDWFLFLDARMKQASVRPIKQVHARLA